MPKEKDWHELEADAITELQLAMNHFGFRTKTDRSVQRSAITKAINLLLDADAILQSMEAIRCA